VLLLQEGQFEAVLEKKGECPGRKLSYLPVFEKGHSKEGKEEMQNAEGTIAGKTEKSYLISLPALDRRAPSSSRPHICP